MYVSGMVVVALGSAVSLAVAEGLSARGLDHDYDVKYISDMTCCILGKPGTCFAHLFISLLSSRVRAVSGGIWLREFFWGPGGFFLGWGKRARSGSVGYILMACTSNEWYPVRNINPMCLCVVCEMATCNVLVADIEVVTMLNNIYNVEWRRRRSMTTQTGRICPAWSTLEVRDVSILPDS